MRAVVFEGVNKLQVKDTPKPVIQESNDAIVRITSASICRSDLKILHGKYLIARAKPGLILGHEGVGVVEKIGPQVKTVKIGDRVVVSNNTQCGTCFYCIRGIYSSCEKGGWLLGNVIDGTQAEFVRVPYADMSLLKVPEDFDDIDALPISDIASTAFFGVERGGVKPGDVVAVFGLGPIGQSVTAITRIFGSSLIIAVDLSDSRLEVAKTSGADVTINPQKEDPVKKIKELTDGRGADVAIEAAGAKTTYEYALNAVRPGGSISILGVFPEAQNLPLQEIMNRNLRIQFGFCDVNRMPELFRLIRSGRLDLRHLFTHTFSLEEALHAYEIFDNMLDNAIKVILKP